MPWKSDQLQGLFRQRGVCKAQLTKMKSFIDSCDSKTQIYDIRVRFQALTDLLKKYDEIQNQIEIQDDTEKEIDDRLEFEDKYFSIKAKMDEYLSSRDNSEEILSERSVRSGTSNKPLLKLPAIKLPTFDGKYENWLSFSDTFKQINGGSMLRVVTSVVE
ncbi:uncharacterized protein LOC142321922 [Lycorma delicatula]|uniref:uncharacterized protein LOC142321922 n=1 Tax=Lycorma delicatula TaxID=130591 RepID=UPI003F515FAD